jgi:hypothetical protein
MFCPKCKYEYIEEIKTCPNCGISLVEKLDDGKDMIPEYVELVTVMYTRDRALIAFVKSILEDAGIKYFVKGESLLGLGRAAIDAEVQVEKNDVEVVKELLRDFL